MKDFYILLRFVVYVDFLCLQPAQLFFGLIFTDQVLVTHVENTQDDFGEPLAMPLQTPQHVVSHICSKSVWMRCNFRRVEKECTAKRGGMQSSSTTLLGDRPITNEPN